jgi:hypothetical protein
MRFYVKGDDFDGDVAKIAQVDQTIFRLTGDA